MSEPTPSTSIPKNILFGGLKDPQMYTEPIEKPLQPLLDSSRKKVLSEFYIISSFNSEEWH